MALHQSRGVKLGSLLATLTVALAGCSNEAPSPTSTAKSAPPGNAATPAGKDTPSMPAVPATASGDSAPAHADSPPALTLSDRANNPLAPNSAATQVQPTPPTQPSDAPKPPPVPKWNPPADTKSVTFLGLTAPKPATWIEHPPQSSMHTTMLTVPGSDGADAANIVVFFFGPGQGGTNEANIKRWADQFKSADGKAVEPKTQSLESDGMPITLVELEGQYMGMGAASSTPNQKMLSAIVDAPAGKVFIRFVGQNTTVDANREAYLNMLKNLQRVEEISK